jgi:hypothetical protein
MSIENSTCGHRSSALTTRFEGCFKALSYTRVQAISACAFRSAKPPGLRNSVDRRTGRKFSLSRGGIRKNGIVSVACIGTNVDNTLGSRKDPHRTRTPRPYQWGMSPCSADRASGGRAGASAPDAGWRPAHASHPATLGRNIQAHARSRASPSRERSPRRSRCADPCGSSQRRE